jgi:hypothetical protein
MEGRCFPGIQTRRHGAAIGTDSKILYQQDLITIHGKAHTFLDNDGKGPRGEARTVAEQPNVAD